MNLVINASKYTEPGGHIELDARREGVDIIVSVRDDGRGIPADQLPSIFEPFAQGELSLFRNTLQSRLILPFPAPARPQCKQN